MTRGHDQQGPNIPLGELSPRDLQREVRRVLTERVTLETDELEQIFSLFTTEHQARENIRLMSEIAAMPAVAAYLKRDGAEFLLAKKEDLYLILIQ